MFTKKLLSFSALIASAGIGLALLRANETTTSPLPEVAYPEGYRNWRFLSSAVLLPKEGSANPAKDNIPSPQSPKLIHNIYANEKAQEGLRTGHFPEGAVLIADWFVLKEAGPELIQGPRKSINVMVRDARSTMTGGWAFEDFDKDSHIIRNVRQNAVKACFECHRHAEDHEYVFSSLKP
jgi:hypothetical protein